MNKLVNNKYVKYGSLGLAGLGLITALSSVYTVNEKEQVVVKRLGEPVSVVLGSEVPGSEVYENKLATFKKYNQSSLETPITQDNIHLGAGLYFKMPFVDKVHVVPNTLGLYDTAADKVPTKDKKTLEMDVFGPFKIMNPLAYLDKLKTPQAASRKIDQVVDPIKARIAGQYNLIEFVRSTNDDLKMSETGHTSQFETIEVGREKLMQKITDLSNTRLEEFGVEMPHIRIQRADYPSANEGPIMQRMISERDRITQQYTSQGTEEANKITSKADKEAEIIKSTAQKEAEIIKKTADARANQIYADAFSQDPEFFRFQRTLENYPASFKDGTTVVLDPTSGYTQYFGNNQNNQ